MSQPPTHRGACRYVVLHHTGVDDPHYDLLFETSPTSPLVAFRLAQWPPLRSQPAIKLRDHRRLYLTYQGVIAGARGQVDRIDEGTFDLAETLGDIVLSHTPDRPFARIEPPEELDSDEWWFHLAERA